MNVLEIMKEIIARRDEQYKNGYYGPYRVVIPITMKDVLNGPYLNGYESISLRKRIERIGNVKIVEIESYTDKIEVRQA